MPPRFWVPVLFVAVSIAALLSAPSIQAQTSISSMITESERSIVFGKSTSTVTAIQVVCLATATSTINVTRTVTSYTGLQTAFVVKTVVTVTQQIVVTMTSTTTITTCYVYNQRIVATRPVSWPLVLYSEVQPASSTFREGSTTPGLPTAESWPSVTELLVVALIAFSLFAAVLLLLAWQTKSVRPSENRASTGFKAILRKT